MRIFDFSRFKNKTINLSPPKILALGFLSFIIFGTLILKMPLATTHPISWMDAVFTATSAVTITGLAVVDTGSTYTTFGQIMILVMVQFGGLGFMTFAVLAAMSLSPRIGLKQQVRAQDALGQTSLAKVSQVAQSVVLYTLFFEIIGAMILTSVWTPQVGFMPALYQAIFFSVSAFNNAGFSLFSDSLMQFEHQPVVLFTISTLSVIGAIGFLILIDIKQNKRWSKLQTNSKIILVSVALLNLIGFLLIWLLEIHNPATLGALPFADQVTAAWFQATSPRSSGFNSIDTAQLYPATSFIIMLLMFIGGGSLSTGGGIKVGTFVVLVLSVLAFLRRSSEIRIFNHAISRELSMKALAVTFVTFALITVGNFILLVLEPQQDFLDLSFEAVSAACTVGLSRGITGELSSASLMVLSFLMFAGRLGPLSLVYLIATPKESRLKHPAADIQIG